MFPFPYSLPLPSSSTVTFQSSQEFQECLSALNAAIALSTPATDSSNRPSVMVSQTRDQCLRPYDWDQILTLASAKYYSPWSVICEGGKSISGLFQVVEGSVVVVKEGGGKEVMGSLLPMDVYGLVSFIDFAPAKLYLSAGEGGAMVAGLEATDLLKMFKQDHVLASKFYTYIALSLSKNLTMLTTRAAAVKKPKGQGGAKGGSKEKGAGKGDEGEDKEESVVVSAVLCRRRFFFSFFFFSFFFFFFFFFFLLHFNIPSFLIGMLMVILLFITHMLPFCQRFLEVKLKL